MGDTDFLSQSRVIRVSELGHRQSPHCMVEGLGGAHGPGHSDPGDGLLARGGQRGSCFLCICRASGMARLRSGLGWELSPVQSPVRMGCGEAVPFTYRTRERIHAFWRRTVPWIHGLSLGATGYSLCILGQGMAMT